MCIHADRVSTQLIDSSARVFSDNLRDSLLELLLFLYSLEDAAFEAPSKQDRVEA